MSTLLGGAPLVALAVCITLAACHNRQESATEGSSQAADSVVLERSRCFGNCPAYRLRIGRDGAVAQISRDPADTAGTKTDSIARSQVEWLVDEAERIGFYSLPKVIADDSTLCPLRATDHPTATVTMYLEDSTHTVVDYQGCYTSHDRGLAPKVQELRRFEAEIDSIAGVRIRTRAASR
jgi:hypothetical protein